MNCIELDPLIYPYLDGELDETELGDSPRIRKFAELPRALGL